MEIQSTRGIVLSSASYGEGDVISVILTENYGKRKFSFRGLKRSKRRPMSAAEAGSLISLRYYFKEGRDILSAGELSLEDNFSAIRESLERIYSAHIILEAVDKSTGRDANEKRIFLMLEGALRSLCVAERPYSLAAFFLTHLLREHGIFPAMNRCVLCGRTDYARFTLREGDLHPRCADCSPPGRVVLNGNIREYLDQSGRRKFSGLDHERFADSEIKSLLSELIYFIEGHYCVELKSGLPVFC